RKTSRCPSRGPTPAASTDPARRHAHGRRPHRLHRHRLLAQPHFLLAAFLFAPPLIRQGPLPTEVLLAACLLLAPRLFFPPQLLRAPRLRRLLLALRLLLQARELRAARFFQLFLFRRTRRGQSLFLRRAARLGLPAFFPGAPGRRLLLLLLLSPGLRLPACVLRLARRAGAAAVLRAL